jgi:hypothetical protein
MLFAEVYLKHVADQRGYMPSQDTYGRYLKMIWTWLNALCWPDCTCDIQGELEEFYEAMIRKYGLSSDEDIRSCSSYGSSLDSEDYVFDSATESDADSENGSDLGSEMDSESGSDVDSGMNSASDSDMYSEGDSEANSEISIFPGSDAETEPSPLPLYEEPPPPYHSGPNNSDSGSEQGYYSL